MERILGIIPARGGSKRVPGKNIRPLAGKPLIAWTIETALASTLLDKVIVSTDAPEIAEIARSYGAEVPFLRPAELAQDDTPDRPVYQHAIEWLAKEQDFCPDLVVWLRPTVPLRLPLDIDEAVKTLRSTQGSSVRSVSAVEHHPYWMKTLSGENKLAPLIPGADEYNYYQRQLLPPVYRLNGAVEVTRYEHIMHSDKLYGDDMRGYVMPPERSIDIDTEEDIALITYLLESRVNSNENR
jgi:CMP-N-acetylneuraminic acid synthetase